MTLLFGHVRRWRPADLEAAYAGLDGERREILRLADRLDAAAQPQSWTGDAAAAAKSRLDKLTDRMEHIVAEVAAAARAVGDVADEVAAVAGWVTEAETLARRHGLHITHDGSVEEIEFNLSDLNVFERRARKNEVREIVARVMSRAQEIDEYVTSVFNGIAAGRVSDGGTATLAAANVAGDHAGSLHAYLINKYRVSKDPDGMVLYPDGAEGWALARAGHRHQVVTKSEAELLSDLGLAGVKDSYDIYRNALHAGETVYGGHSRRDGHSDAFRHAYWNALLANRFGQDWAEQFTTAHERRDNRTPAAEAMDLYNNEVGRRIAAEHPDAGPQELHRLVDEAVRRGDMVVIHPDGTLVRSNEIAMGETGSADDEPPAPEADPPRPQIGAHASGGYNPGTDGENYGTYDND